MSLGPDEVSWNQPSENWNFPENIITPFDNAITVKLCLLTTLVSVNITQIFHFLRIKTDKIRRKAKFLKIIRKLSKKLTSSNYIMTR